MTKISIVKIARPTETAIVGAQGEQIVHGAINGIDKVIVVFELANANELAVKVGALYQQQRSECEQFNCPTTRQTRGA